LGSITAPIVGGAMTDSIGYRSACDVIAFACLGFYLLYTVTNTRPKDYICKKRESPNKDIVSNLISPAVSDYNEKNDVHI
jgi:hypothetical protein